MAATENDLVYAPRQPKQQIENAYGQLQISSPTKFYPIPEAAEYYEIAQNPEIFMEKLQDFHRALGIKFKVPTLGGKALDLHRLFVEVTSRGGIEKVVTDRRWKEVTVVFNFPSTITSASFVLRKYYLSLLYHFEQVYYLRKKVPSPLVADSVSRIVNGSASLHVLEDGAAMNQFSYQASPNLEPGSSVTGTIDAKFDSGYLITVNLGSEKLKGVLYHTPMGLQTSQSSNPSDTPPHRKQKRFHVALTDPSRPKVYQDKGLRDEESYGTEMVEYRSSNHSQAQ